MTNEVYVIFEESGSFSDLLEKPLFFVSSKEEAIKTVEFLEEYSKWLRESHKEFMKFKVRWEKENPRPEEEKRWRWIDPKLIRDNAEYKRYCKNVNEWVSKFLKAKERFIKEVKLPENLSSISDIDEISSLYDLDNIYYSKGFRYSFRAIEEKHILKDNDEQDR